MTNNDPIRVLVLGDTSGIGKRALRAAVLDNIELIMSVDGSRQAPKDEFAIRLLREDDLRNFPADQHLRPIKAEPLWLGQSYSQGVSSLSLY